MLKPPENQSPLFDDKVRHSCGATSSKCPRFDLIPLEGLVEAAGRFEEGLAKHGKNNWRAGIGDRAFIIERLNHVIYHASKLIEKVEGRRPWDGDNDASAIAWAGLVLPTMLRGVRQEEGEGEC